MKCVVLLVSLTLSVFLYPKNSFALGDDYVIVLYSVNSLQETDPNSSKINSSSEGQKFSVQQDLHIASGTFQIKLIPGNQDFYHVQKYRNELTRMIERRKKTNQWKIALKKSEINEAVHQQNMQEILRQLNADKQESSEENREKNVLGWQVRIQEDLLDDHVLQARALRELSKQLTKIRSRVPYKAMKQLQVVKIFIYKDKDGVDENVTAYYSPLYKAVVFHNANKLYNLSDRQNAVVLHELAHGYHDIVLGHDNQKIKDAYDNAVKTGLYQNVKTQNGMIAAKAYALTNHAEYFAELTETYFSRRYGSFENDYYPFNIYDLKKYDEVGYNLAKDLWGR